ncbi:NupC/NupG family nucleoside CNT transporter [Photobacterium andalusiense]|uniref:Nucleoside permease NupX n=1 Tax=Photobacterium andalusiense TaxID=2204296 RepID=A0A1Y6MPL3_9GAMM|nr:nucleoside transporter C-terminal domain-containing protein [Photobacterium andalusiense]SMY38352.1 Nucleoside permease NupX [Photobacterium andalusiense]
MSIITSIIGMIVLIAIAVLLSENRKKIRFRTVFGALMIQIGFGAFVMYVPAGQMLLQGIATGVNNVISYANDGLSFAFGDLAQYKLGFIFLINVLCVVIFISALISVLYYLKIMQKIVGLLGKGLKRPLGISYSESMSATANIFVGPIEAPTTLRPFIATMTRSELFAIMTGGLASVAGGTMIGYINLGIDVKYILTACFMTAPAGLLFAKLMCPETETPRQDLDQIIEQTEDKPETLLDAITQGAMVGLHQVGCVTALLIAIVALMAMVNGIIGGIAAMLGFDGVTIQLLLGYLLAPLAFLLGVPWSEATLAASFIGQKIIVNEFIAYVSFIEVADQLSEKTQAIVVFALCGFANIGSLALVIGGLRAMAPTRGKELSQIGGRTLIAAILANLMSGTIAGLLVSLGAVV